MKININLIFLTVVFIALFKNAHGGLVLGIVGKIHDTIHKVHEDVHNIFKPKEKSNQNLISVNSDNSQRENKANEPDTAFLNNEKRDNDEKIIFATSEDQVNEKVINNNNPVIATPVYDVRQKNEVKESTTEEIFVFASSPSTPSPVSTTTQKEGRENFAAGCSTGYKRTPDGRCKPTF